MKKLFFVIAATTLFAACNGSKAKDDANANVPQGMFAADLSTVSEGGMQVLLNVPDSTAGPLEITANPQGGADIKVGKGFQVTVIEGNGDINQKKKDIEHDDVKKLVKYLVDDPNSLVWEWQIDGMEPEFHFYTIQKAGNKSYEIHDVEGESFSEKAATQMLDAAKSIRQKEAKKAS